MIHQEHYLYLFQVKDLICGWGRTLIKEQKAFNDDKIMDYFINQKYQFTKG